MFEVTALPAKYGDCLWIEYGNPAQPNVILVDGGTGISTDLKCKLEQLKIKGGHIELVIVTHIDGDHIAGIIGLLKNRFFGVTVRDFWFNGLRHLPGEAFSEKQGEKLTEQILKQNISWNADFGGEAISVDKSPLKINLPGGAIINLLSPDDLQLKKLRKRWIEVCEDAGLYADPIAENASKSQREAFGMASIFDVDALADTPFEEDQAPANGSSIAFILCYGGKRLLLGADAYPSRLLKSLQALEGIGPYKFDLVKLPHHGSKSNVSINFIKELQSPRYLFSSNGSIYKHPCPEGVARVVREGGKSELIFNYCSAFTKPWDDPILMANYEYTVMYGINGLVKVVIS